MSTALRPIITDAGLQAVFAASNAGVAAEITHVAVGTGRYAPDAARTTLQSEAQRVAVAGGQRTGPKTIAIGALVEGEVEYWVNEVGFFLADGTLFAVWSNPERSLAFKSASVPLSLTFDLALLALPDNAVSWNASTPNLNLSVATEFAALATADLTMMNQLLALQQQLQALDKRVKALETP